MSSEISRIEAWTGRFLSWEKMTIPKTRPSAHTTSPHMRSARPPTPPNVTVPRSGTLRLASPPPAASAGGGATETSARTTSAGRSPTAACVALYVISLIFDPLAALRPRGFLEVFSPSAEALWALGAAGAIPWHYGRWWTLFTAIYLHGGLLHILFNVLWIRQLGPAVEEIYGPARLVVIFTVSGVAGFVVSNSLGVPFTIGASGSF